MSGFTLTCCSTCDMPPAFFEARNIPFVCFHFLIDGKEYPDDLGKSMSFAEFYKRIDGGSMPTTSQVNVEQYTAFFKPFLDDGQDILHLTLSSGISGTYGSACIARDELKAQYPDRKIYIVDSLAASSGYGLFMTLAADMRDSGADVDTVYKWAEDFKLNLHHWVFTSDLSHLKRGGRVSATSAFMGTLLGICPIIEVDYLGRLDTVHKVRGKKGAIEYVEKKMEAHAQNGTDYSSKCYISNSACIDDAKALAALIESRFPKLDGKVGIYDIGTVIGSHTGPGTVALFFVGDKRVDTGK